MTADGDRVGSAPGFSVTGLARIVLVGLPVLVIGGWLLLGLGHLTDRFNVNAVSGTFLALADRARDGVLYPPLFDGQSYSGTRTMPIPVLLYAAALSFGGDILASAKVVDLIASAALLVILVGVLIRLGASAALSLALAATVVTTQVFLLAATGIRPESLPSALQLGAVALVAFVPRRSAIVVAAVLCSLAIFCKLTALWAPIAIVVWLATRNRVGLVWFLGTLAVASGALLATFVVASDGRMLSNLLGLGGAGLSVTGVLKSPLKVAQLFVQYAQASVILLPVLLLALVFVSRRSRPSIFQIGLAAAGAILLVVEADVGSDYNHLLDVVVLLPIATFQVVQRIAARITEDRIVWSILVASLLVGSAAGLASNMAASLAATLRLPGSSETGLYDPLPLRAALGDARSVLAEDPYVALARGERPVVLDPFMLLRIARRDPDVVEPLLARIRSQDFDAVVLGEDLQAPDTASWFSESAFGLPFLEAIGDHYRRCSAMGGYFVYFANALPCPGTGDGAPSPGLP